MHFAVQTGYGTPLTEINPVTFNIAQLKITRGHTHPAQATFVMYAPQYEMPLALNDFISIWDDAATNSLGPGDTVQVDQHGNIPGSNSNYPLFEGFIDEVSPGEDSNLVKVTCYDQTKMASRQITVFSEPWQSQGTSVPIPGVNAVPRLVASARLASDPDYAYSIGDTFTTGQLMQKLFDMAQVPLQYWNAAPSVWPCYDVTDDLNNFTYNPQDKVLFESEIFNNALESLMRWEPGVKLFFYPGLQYRIWRFLNIYEAPTNTITLNSFNGPYKALSFDLTRSQKDRWTAVRVYGKQPLIDTLFSNLSDDGSLTPYQSQNVGTDGNGNPVDALTALQVTNPLQRHLGRLLNNQILIGASGQTPQYTRYVTLQASYDALTWYLVPWVSADWQNGIIYFDPVYITQSDGSGSTTFTPGYWRLWAPYQGSPFEIRVPNSGWQGTAFTIANVQAEMQIYDEMMDLGYTLQGAAITDEERLAQFTTYATKLLQQRQDLIHSGGIVLQGLVYDFLQPYQRISIAAVDQNGNPLTTGWEGLYLFLTDVEFDFDNMTTTLQFSSDQLELCGYDPEVLKKLLHIKALMQVNVGTAAGFFGMQGGSVSSRITSYFVDPNALPQSMGGTGGQGFTLPTQVGTTKQ